MTDFRPHSFDQFEAFINARDRRAKVIAFIALLGIVAAILVFMF